MHPEDQPLYSKGVVTIGNNVRIADKVTILSGVTIGDNSTIGANAVVTHDIPAGVIAAGVPARVISRKIALRNRVPSIHKPSTEIPL